jgi:hypothetical protein
MAHLEEGRYPRVLDHGAPCPPAAVRAVYLQASGLLWAHLVSPAASSLRLLFLAWAAPRSPLWQKSVEHRGSAVCQAPHLPQLPLLLARRAGRR